MAPTPLLRLLFALAVLAGPHPVTAELFELPFQMPLDTDWLVLELWNADVDLRVDPEAEPALLAVTADESAALELDVYFDGGILTVRRPAESPGGPRRGGLRRMRLEVAVAPAQAVTLEGRDLAVTATDARSVEELSSEDEEVPSGAEELPYRDEGRTRSVEAAGGPGVPAEPGGGEEDLAGPGVFRLDLEGSRVDFAGTRNAVMEGRRTSVWLTRTTGSFGLNLEGGSAEIRGHQGDLVLESSASEVSVYDLRGRLEPRMIGGSLDVRQGTGIFDGTVEDAVVLFDGWLGYVTLRGAGVTLEARGVDEPRPWNIEGTDLLVSLEGMAGPVTANLSGGTFRAGTMGGRVAVAATLRADVELANLTRGADVKLSQGSTARLFDVFGQVKVELDDAELRGQGIGNLLVTGRRATVDVGAVDRLAQLELTDSSLVLDMTSSAHSSSLKLMGSSGAVVRLAAPCIVRVTGPAGSERSPVGVSGCELRLPGLPSRPAGGRLVYGEKRPMTLTAWLEESVELEVVGLP